jgi:hypothetical protein
MAMTEISSARRFTRDRAIGSPSSAARSSMGASPIRSSSPILPLWMPMVTCSTRSAAKKLFTYPVSAVSGPRPSSARTACHKVSMPRPRPPPQSPEIVPKAGYLVTRPSGATPTQLMPAPQTTATPQRGWTSSSRPARRIANVSLTTVVVGLQPKAWIAAPCSASSSGRSALARQATVCRATTAPSRSAWAAACLTTASRISTVWSMPTSWALMPGPRAEASSVPSPATRATSVLLLPPSMASTAGSTP